ncbi:MAG: hypothetical protein ACOVMH_08890 [Flavobacterium sp.]
MPDITCDFFAILKDNSIRKIDLLQGITEDIRNVFISNGLELLNHQTEEIELNGEYKVDDNEILFVEMSLPSYLLEATLNPIGTNVLNLGIDDIRAIYWVEDGVYYFQNFDRRKLLQNRSVIFWSGNSYNKLTEHALIVENVVHAIHRDGKFYFKSYVNANKIFSLIDFFQEATNEQIVEFSTNDKLQIDVDWLKNNANTLLRKQITLIQNSKILETIKPKKIVTSAKKFNLLIDFQDGKLVMPNDLKKCKDILSFINEQYFIGIITGNKYRTNSKRSAEK